MDANERNDKLQRNNCFFVVRGCFENQMRAEKSEMMVDKKRRGMNGGLAIHVREWACY